MNLQQLRQMKPFASAIDKKTGEYVAIYEPWWSANGRFPVRKVGLKGRAVGRGRVVAAKRLEKVIAFPGGIRRTKRYFRHQIAKSS